MRRQRQAKLLAHHASKEAADRVLLPIRCLHDRGDCCTVRLAKKGENSLLFGPATARSRRRVPRFPTPFRAAVGALRLCLIGHFAVRHFRIPSVATASGAVTAEAPQWRYRQRGRGPNGAERPLSSQATVTLHWRWKSSPFCQR